jgi:hypothetical protein
MVVSGPVLVHIEVTPPIVLVPGDEHGAVDPEIAEIAPYIILKIETKVLIFNFYLFLHRRFPLQRKINLNFLVFLLVDDFRLLSLQGTFRALH